jgi:hypothetical protein
MEPREGVKRPGESSRGEVSKSRGRCQLAFSSTPLPLPQGSCFGDKYLFTLDCQS